MTVPVLAPMEAKLIAELPNEPGWQYELKWDGFRALILLRNGSRRRPPARRNASVRKKAI